MTATIVHFGQDNCFRLLVLRGAGYIVEACDSLDRLATLLTTGVEAVLLEDEAEFPIVEALALTRVRSQVPVILFLNDPDAPVPEGFDLVIPTLTAPHAWLNQIAHLLDRNRPQRDAGTTRRPPASVTEKPAAIRVPRAAVNGTLASD